MLNRPPTGRDNGAYLSEVFNEWMNKYELIGDVRGLGLLWAIELVTDRKAKAKAFDIAEKIMYGCLESELNFKVSQGNIIQLSPPLTIAKEELDAGLGIIEAQLKEFS